MGGSGAVGHAGWAAPAPAGGIGGRGGGGATGPEVTGVGGAGNGGVGPDGCAQLGGPSVVVVCGAPPAPGAPSWETRSSVGVSPACRWASCRARPNAAADGKRCSGSLAMARSMARHTSSGTPQPRRSGTGSTAMRVIMGTSDSSVSRKNAGFPASIV